MTLNTRSSLDSRWEMVDEREVDYCCPRCPARREISPTGHHRWSRAAPCCSRAALNAHLNRLDAPLTWTWTWINVRALRIEHAGPSSPTPTGRENERYGMRVNERDSTQ